MHECSYSLIIIIKVPWNIIIPIASEYPCIDRFHCTYTYSSQMSRILDAVGVQR